MSYGVTSKNKLAASYARMEKKRQREFADLAGKMREEREAAAEREREATRQANEEYVARFQAEQRADWKAKGEAFRERQIAEHRAYHRFQGPYAWLDDARFEAKWRDELLLAFERFLDGPSEDEAMAAKRRQMGRFL